MFGIDFSGMRQTFQAAFDAQFRLWVGAAFVALALAAIQYDEIIAPELSRIGDAWSTAAGKLTSFTL